MKNKLRILTMGTIFGLLLVIGGARFFVSGQEFKYESSEEFSNASRLVGTWQTVVTPRNCANGTPVAPAFPGILTFNKGGTLTGTSTTLSSVFGVWERETGRRNYSLAFISLRYNATGAFIGTQRVRQTVELDANGNEFTSNGAVEMLDTNGTVVGTGCATSTGTRFE